jgi:galactokinase
MAAKSHPMLQKVFEKFADSFGHAPAWVVRAPGRVNLIGEHTDYNEGFVMPMAIDRATWIALRPRDDHSVSLESADFHETAAFDLDRFEKGDMSWGEYVKGVAWALQAAGFPLRGWEGVSLCDVPMGAGLSSSASFELAVARAFSAVGPFEWHPGEMAVASQNAENHWVGVNCGIMDQMISASGQQGHAVLIDCRDLSTTPVPLPPQTAILVMDTGTRRGLVESAYNERRAQCEAAAAHLGIQSLRDITLEAFESFEIPDDSPVWRRARHVVSENERTLAAAAAMRNGDAVALGKLMDQSHRSLRDDFEVSCPQLDSIVAIARRIPGCLGARMTGAGFGGCAVALVEAASAAAIIKTVEDNYEKETGIAARIYQCEPSNGAEVISAAQ